MKQSKLLPWLLIFQRYKYILNNIDSRPSLNGSVAAAAALKNRPRIPTPDVTREGMEKENRFNLTPVASSMMQQSSGSGLAGMGASNIAAGVALAARKLATEPSVYAADLDDDHSHPVATLQLSPIKELDSGSVNNTLHPHSPSTVELARALQAGGGAFGTITTTTSRNNFSYSV